MKQAYTIAIAAALFALITTGLKSSPAQLVQKSEPLQLSEEEELEADSSQNVKMTPTTLTEARGRARILHETLHGSLQVMHRDFFRKDDSRKIPSRSLEDVFSELAQSYGVQLNWIAVDVNAMNIDNEPDTQFEKDAAAALKSGKEEFEAVTNEEYRFAGRIRLSATCLSCHASRRSSNDDRFAGLVVILPLQPSK